MQSSLSRLGGARSYVPREVRDKAASRDLQHKYRKLVARESRNAPDSGAAPGIAHATAPFLTSGGDNNGDTVAVISRKRARFDAPDAVTQPPTRFKGADAIARLNAPAVSQPPTRFKGAEAIARARASAHEAARATAVDNDAARARAAVARRVATRVVRRKTHKGQPLLSARMGGLLAKIEKEVGFTSTSQRH